MKVKLLMTKSMDKKPKKKSQFGSRPWRPAGTPNPDIPVVEKIEPVTHNKDFAMAKTQSPQPPSTISHRPRLNVG